MNTNQNVPLFFLFGSFPFLKVERTGSKGERKKGGKGTYYFRGLRDPVPGWIQDHYTERILKGGLPIHQFDTTRRRHKTYGEGKSNGN